MKCQALFSMKILKIKMSSVAVVAGNLLVKNKTRLVRVCVVLLIIQ